jgi:hypothetical protein
VVSFRLVPYSRSAVQVVSSELEFHHSTVRMKCTRFWDTRPCSRVEIYRRFRGTHCLHLQGKVKGKIVPVLN